MSTIKVGNLDPALLDIPGSGQITIFADSTNLDHLSIINSLGEIYDLVSPSITLASNVSYDDTLLGLGATNVQLALDELGTTIQALSTAFNYIGGYDASTDTPSLDDGSPIGGILTGDAYVVTVAGNFFATAVNPGDTLISNQNAPTLESHWTIVQPVLNAATIKAQYESNSNTNAYTDADQTTVSYITVTQSVDLDQMESDIATNNAKVSNVTTDLSYTAGATNGIVISSDGTDAIIPPATTSLAGLMTDADKTKLDGITSGANNYSHPNHTGEVISTGDGAQVIQSSAITNRSSAIVASGDLILISDIDDSNNLKQVTAQSIANLSGGGGSTNLSIINRNATTLDVASDTGTDATVPAATTSLSGLMTGADKTKLDGVTAGADITNSTTVDAAGAVMNSDTTTSAMQFVIDEDTMISDSNIKVPTQQSVKAYVDTEIASAITSGMRYQGNYDASTDTPSLDNGSPIAGILIGDTYTVTVAGNFFTKAVEIGDTLIAKQDSPVSETHWTIVQANLTPASIKTQYESNSDTNAYTDSEKTKVSYIAVTQSVDLDQMESDIATNNAKVSNVTTDLSITNQTATNLDVSSSDGTDATIPSATISLAGLMTASDKTKLDGVASGADITNETNVINALDGSTIINAVITSTDKVLFQDVDDSDNLKQDDAQTLANLYNIDATDTVKGRVELTTIAEVNSGTDTTRATTSDSIAGSYAGTKGFTLAIFDSDVSVTTGDGKIAFTIPSSMNGMNLINVVASVHDKGITGTTDIQIRRRRAGANIDMLSTKITIGDEFFATDESINVSNDDVQTGDQIYVDVDAVHSGTAPKGLSVTCEFRLP